MKRRCPRCGEVFEAEPDGDRVLHCPCGARIRLRPKPDEAARAPDPPRRVAAARTVEAESPARKGKLPAVMRANKVIAGRFCPACNGPIALGEEVHNCERCDASHHAPCWDERGGCSGPGCDGAHEELVATPSEPDQDAGDTEPCRFCGELIKKSALKCRFCNEFKNEADRAAQAAKAAPGAATGDQMTTGDWIIALICSGIGCIFGVIWAIQGKKKAGKMILVSLLAALFWTFMRAVIVAAG